MNHYVTHVPTTAMLIAVATTLAGVGALVWKNTTYTSETPALRAARLVPVWARAAAIVASTAGALLLLVRQKA